jgi:hypothetical protein
MLVSLLQPVLGCSLCEKASYNYYDISQCGNGLKGASAFVVLFPPGVNSIPLHDTTAVESGKANLSPCKSESSHCNH